MVGALASLVRFFLEAFAPKFGRNNNTVNPRYNDRLFHED